LNRWNLDELDIVISHKHSPLLLTLLISGHSRPYTPFALFSLLIVLFIPAPRVELWEGNRCRSNLLPAATEVANPPSEFIYQFRCTQQPALHASATEAIHLGNASTQTRNTHCCISLCGQQSISTLVLQLFWHNKRRTLARDAYFCCSDLLSPSALLGRITTVVAERVQSWYSSVSLFDKAGSHFASVTSNNSTCPETTAASPTYTASR